MSARLDLQDLPRGTLLDPPDRRARLQAALQQIRVIVEGERDAVALQATLACLLWDALAQANWCGFYRRVEARELAVGPYQGSMGCMRISFDRGICGLAARTQSVQRIADVRERPEHIACDARTLSELVVPVLDARGELRAVLDIDAPHVDAFSHDEAELLVALMAEVFGRPDVRW